MVPVLISRLILLVFGTLYPAYASYKTVKTKNVRGYVKWMMYWIVYAVYTTIEIFTDIFLSFWFPFYYELKVLFVFWLICPATRGSTYLFRKVIYPQLSKHEVMIDSYIESLWDQGYDVVRRIGAQGLEFMRHFIAELFQKGQVTATNFMPQMDDVPDSAVQQSPDRPPFEGNFPDEHTLDEEDFAILMAENPEYYRGAELAGSPNRKEENVLNESDADSEETSSVKTRPLKLPKSKGRNMVLRERKRKNTK